MLFEQLGEEYPDTLGRWVYVARSPIPVNGNSFSIIAAEGAIANVVGMTQMQPPVKDLCMIAL